MSHRSIFVRRERTVRDVLNTVYPQTEVQWLNALASQTNPETALASWEIIAFAFYAFFEARTPTAKSRHQALRVLLNCSAGRSETEIHEAAHKGISITESPDRGTPHDATPPTPPGIRVRTTAGPQR